MGVSKVFPFERDKRLKAQEPVELIEADEITVEVVDKHTGVKYRRTLPVTYRETANGVLLKGETATGEPVGITFFSESALAKLGELFGKGPDVHRCDGHEDI